VILKIIKFKWPYLKGKSIEQAKFWCESFFVESMSVPNFIKIQEGRVDLVWNVTLLNFAP